VYPCPFFRSGLTSESLPPLTVLAGNVCLCSRTVPRRELSSKNPLFLRLPPNYFFSRFPLKEVGDQSPSGVVWFFFFGGPRSAIPTFLFLVRLFPQVCPLLVRYQRISDGRLLFRLLSAFPDCPVTPFTSPFSALAKSVARSLKSQKLRSLRILELCT